MGTAALACRLSLVACRRSPVTNHQPLPAGHLSVGVNCDRCQDPETYMYTLSSQDTIPDPHLPASTLCPPVDSFAILNADYNKITTN